MNAKKICALALSLGLSASFATKSDAGLIKDAFKAAGLYAGSRFANTLIPKYATSYAGWWRLTVEKGGDLVKLTKGYIDAGVDAVIKFAEKEFDLEKEFGKVNKYANVDNIDEEKE